MGVFEDSSVTARPQWSAGRASELLRDRWGLAGEVDELPSERDQNFRLVTESRERFVLKVSNPGEDRSILDLQDAALCHLSADEVDHGTPEPVPAGGETILQAEGPDGTSHFVRLMTWVAGVPLARTRPHTDLFEPLGRFLAALDRRLASFHHPAADRAFYWDLRRGLEVAGGYVPAIEDRAGREQVGRMLARIQASGELFDTLPRQVIHADANDYNLIIRRRPAGPAVGLIDFGDMVSSWRVGDLAILLAYAMLDRRDPLSAAAAITRAYHRVNPLEEAEVEALFPLACLRLCTSVSIAAHQRARVPDNDYLGVTERPARRLLETLDTIHPRLAWYTLREACGLEPCPASPEVSAWIERHRERAHPLVEPDPGTGAFVLDCSVGGSVVRPDEVADGHRFTERVATLIRESGHEVGIGRYAEPRIFYASDQFGASGEELPERRTLHLGVDLFQPAGSAVYAPFDGVVHSWNDNDLALDYGPTLVLEHDADGTPFYSLFGHLTRASLEGKQPGERVAAGEKIAEMGDVDVNGGWPPHLHFQVIADMLDEKGNFPGVARPSQFGLWSSLVPDVTSLVPHDGVRYRETAVDLRERRSTRLGACLSLSYQRPLTIVRGDGAYLYDPSGHAYLDCVNNVCHVGHARGEVVDAAERQMRRLNTNTRYLHPTILDYADRLAAWFPDPLSVCLFVNSGSEANELALRLARTFTGRDGILAVEAGYHGHTQDLIEVGSYKCEGTAGLGPPEHVRFVPLPDPFRGRYRGGDRATAERYAAHVPEQLRALEAAGHPAAAFLAEAWSGCGGQIVPPDGWLEAAFCRAREAGVVCIADEVQTGFGRPGGHRWAFEQQGARPDIVTLGKPIGNGHPLAAVITTPEIAAAFDNGMEYFNTFGGNPVSCATGLAVLDVIERDGLQAHAERVGGLLLDGLRERASRHPWIGDVRGGGLFLGVELVQLEGDRRPSPLRASRLVERMRDHGILLSVDGPRHNVIKIKPPMTFSEADARFLLQTLDRILIEDWTERDD